MRIDKDSDFKHKSPNGGNPDSTRKGTASSQPTTQDISGATPRPWLKGYPPGGITGPNTPVHTGVTVSESCRRHEWARIVNNHSEPPSDTHIIITKGSDTVAIVCGDVEEISAEANAELIVAAVNNFSTLVSVCEAVSNHYAASLDHQPGYVRLAREALATCGSTKGKV